MFCKEINLISVAFFLLFSFIFFLGYVGPKNDVDMLGGNWDSNGTLGWMDCGGDVTTAKPTRIASAEEKVHNVAKHAWWKIARSIQEVASKNKNDYIRFYGRICAYHV